MMRIDGQRSRDPSCGKITKGIRPGKRARLKLYKDAGLIFLNVIEVLTQNVLL